MRRRHGTLAAVVLAVGLAPTGGRAGAYLFAGETHGIDVVAHPTGYTGAGGVATVTVCIDPTSPHAADMVVPLQNVVATWNALAATTGNLHLGAANDIPGGRVDFESVALHEVGHCVGLAHPNLATESGLGEPDRNHTKSTPGPNGVYDLGVGADGVRGSPDDQRGDDVNLHWFRRDDNDPFSVGPLVDASTYAVAVTDLPAGHSFAANADRTVATLFGVPNTEAVMQQGTFTDEAQRTLAGDDVGTIRLAASGLDRTQGTGDDYVLDVHYAGLTTSCDIVVAFDDAKTAFASCQAWGQFLAPKHIRITRGEVYFHTGFAWWFTQASTSTTTSTTSTTTSTTTSSSTSTSPTSSNTTTTTTTTPSVPLAGCPAAPASGCIEAARGRLHVNEKQPGRERVRLLMTRFAAPPPPSAFGDPVAGASVYDACVYDATGGLVAALHVDRGGATCGARDAACWRAVSGGGYAYADPALSADGVRRILARGGGAQRARVALLAKNAAHDGRLALPAGIAAALAGASEVTTQVIVSDGACFEMVVSDVRVAHDRVFRGVAR